MAIVDDLDSLTYNPAGLAAQRSELELLTVDVRATSDIYSQYSTLSQIKSASINTVNEVMGRDLFVEANAPTPTHTTNRRAIMKAYTG